MNETKPSETKPRKMVRRSVAITLGMVCIILVASLGVMAYVSYSPTSGSSNAALQAKIDQLQEWLAGNETLLSQTQAWLSGNITTYNSYVADHHHTDEDYTNFYNIANLADSTVWVSDQTISQPASSYTLWTLSASYAGYVSVWVQSSSVAGTHVKAIYSSHGVSFNQEIVVSAGDTASFPILPSSSIQIEVGNGNLVNGATETVTITYYY
ncbi:MAG: hypothetical protein ABSG57_08190 [Candidatus Bathyarchaeia archaeon]